MTLQEIQGVHKQFEYYRTLADKTFLVLSQDDLNWKCKAESNSIAMLIRHISGNLTSRFTNFFTEDGEKPWRNRDEEFADGLYDRHELITNWEKSWAILFHVMDGIDETNIEAKVSIRGQEHSVAEALYRQLAHYSYHIGQLVFLGKMIQDKAWQSLSIPKNKSNDFNQVKFSNPNSEAHFTDNLLK